jgi:NADPH2:quinone reductase
MKAIRVAATGGPEVLRLEETTLPEPRPGQARLRLEAIGVNYIDVYHRTGLYPMPLPFTPGMEAAGVIEALGPAAGVAPPGEAPPGARSPGDSHPGDLQPGDRVAYAMSPGAYAEQAIVSCDRLVKVPDGIEARQAAALMLQGMTAHYLTSSTWPLKPGDTCLVHAAAGGVGLLLCQMARMRGARVIATVSTPDKAERARRAGAHEVILYTREDFAAAARRLTEGAGVQVVYDSVGRATWEGSLDALAPRGLLALFGQSSGPVPPIDPQVLSRKGSLFLTRPTLAHYAADRAELLQRAGEIFGWVISGRLAVTIDRELPLERAAEAHRLLEARATSGKVLLIP